MFFQLNLIKKKFGCLRARQSSQRWFTLSPSPWLAQAKRGLSHTRREDKFLPSKTPIAKKKHMKRLFRIFKCNGYISAKHLLFFARQTGRLLKAGFPLLQILKLIGANIKDASLGQLITYLKLSIENGYSLTESLINYQSGFNSFYYCLISLGEKTSTLDQVFLKIAQHLEKTLKLKTCLTNALLYPSIVMIVSMLVFLALMIGVVPQFEQIFSEVNVPLPALTGAVITLAHVLKKSFIPAFMIILILVIIFKFYKKRYLSISIKQDQFLFRLPIIKDLLSEILTLRLSHALAIALHTGLPLLDALQATSELTKNYVYKKSLLSSCRLVRNGDNLACALAKQKIFPPDFVQLVKVGELSGTLAEVLDNASELYEEKIDGYLDGLSKLVEPLLVVMLGIIIGSLIIAMYLPIFTLGSIV